MKSQITKLIKSTLCLGVAALVLSGSAGATRAYASDSKASTTILTAFEVVETVGYYRSSRWD